MHEDGPLKPKPYLLPMVFQQQQLPPKQYDHEYDGTLIVKYLIGQDLDQQCRSALKPGHRALACTDAFQGEPKKCTIWMLSRDELAARGWDYNIVLRHELGHCNGWKHH